MPASTEIQKKDDCSKLAQIYRFLALSMDYPDKVWLTREHWDAIAATWREIYPDQAAVEFPVFPATPQLLEDLQVEYTRMFINSIPHVIAPMYGSVYLDADGMLYGSSAEKVKAFYHQADFVLKGAGDIPDSLGNQLKFLALLMDEAKEEEAERFLRQCFRPWFKIFFKRVSKETRHPYFQVLVLLINFFTEEEEDHDS